MSKFSSSSSGAAKRKKSIKKEIKSIALIVLLVFTFRSVFFEPFRIPSGSMIPTLMIGDFILVNKFAYGFKVPFSDFAMETFNIDLDPIYFFGKKNPQRGDVVVFKFPKNPAINYIKRVIGLPGDTIEMKDKVLYVNGVPLDRKQIPGKKIMSDMDDKFKNYNLNFYQVKTGKAEHIVQQDTDNLFRADYDKIIVPQDKFFVMGDNRDFSYDSRYWGFISHKHVRGKALFVWFSMILSLPFFGGEDKFKFRYYRIGTSLF